MGSSRLARCASVFLMGGKKCGLSDGVKAFLIWSKELLVMQATNLAAGRVYGIET